MAVRIEPLLTVEDLDACPDDGNRYELVGGELFVSRAPGISHQRVLHNLQKGIRTFQSLSGGLPHAATKALMRFSRAQIIGALLLLAFVWAVILFRMIFSRA
jgi:hypothetical protein